MPEPARQKPSQFQRSTPLGTVAAPGTYGRTDAGAPGVIFRERRDIALASVVCHRKRQEALSQALTESFGLDLPGPGRSATAAGLSLLFAGLDRWTAVSEGEDGPALLHRLAEALGDTAGLADQSHGLCVIEMRGPRILDVLAKGTAADMHPDAFPVGASIATGINHLAVHLWRQDEACVRITLLRSFARDLFEFLATMSLEYGYGVES